MIVIKRVFLFTLFCLFIVLVSITTNQKNIQKGTVFHSYSSGMLVILPEHSSTTQILPRDEIDRVTTIDGVLYYYPFLSAPGKIRGRSVSVIGIDQGIPGANDAYRFYKIKYGKDLTASGKDLTVNGAKKGVGDKTHPGCVISVNLKRSLGVEIGANLKFKTFTCRISGIAKSDELVAANFIVTDILNAQTELIESEHLYRFLNARSVEAVSCGKCHTVMTEAIKKATKEAAEVFEAHSLTSGAFILYSSKADPDAISREARKRIKGAEVEKSDELNYRRIWYYSK